jgi:hypothetical protein
MDNPHYDDYNSDSLLYTWLNYTESDDFNKKGEDENKLLHILSYYLVISMMTLYGALIVAGLSYASYYLYKRKIKEPRKKRGNTNKNRNKLKN